MAINFTRGFIRLWLALSLLILIPTAIVSYVPTKEYIERQSTVGLEISIPEIPAIQVRISDEFSGLSSGEKDNVADRVVFLLGFGTAIETKCAPIREQLKSRGITLPQELPLKPWEVYSLQQSFPEYSDLNFADIKARIEAKLSGCISALSSTPLPDKVEQIARSASIGSGPGSLLPLGVGASIVGVMWLFLFASFWIARGFR